MVIDHLQFGLILIWLVVVLIIDSEELQGVAINLGLAYDVPLRHLDIRLTIAGVTHHNCNLFEWNTLL